MTLAPTAKHTQRVILHCFEESLALWCDLKAKLHAHYHSGKNIAADDSNQITDIPLYIHGTLKDHFAQQEEQIRSISSTTQFAYYKQAQYAIVALIDDQLLQNPPWEKEDWLKHLLEDAMFESRIAGQRLISEIETLVEIDANKQQLSAHQQQLAYIYLSILWQGFKGKLYRNEERLKDLQLSLIQITEYLPANLNAKRLLEQPYNHTSNDQDDEEAENRRLAPITRWHRVVLFGFVIYALISSAIWFGFTWDLNKTLKAFDKTEQEHHQTTNRNANKGGQK